jgi:hypothetical protein
MSHDPTDRDATGGALIPRRTLFGLVLRHADEWVFGELDDTAPNEIEGEYYLGLDDPTSGDPFELSNQHLALANGNPDLLEDLQVLVDNYRNCSGSDCRIYDSQPI